MYLVWSPNCSDIVPSTFYDLEKAREFAAKCAEKHRLGKFWITKVVEEYYTISTHTVRVRSYNT